MSILEKLKSVLGMDGRDGTRGTTDPDVTVEREPATESERAVTGAGAADARGATQSASAPREADEASGDGGTPESGHQAGEVEDHDAAAPDAEGGDGPSTAAEEGIESPAVEQITGIGPTFGERLEAAGIETVGDLAGEDAETIAEAAGTHESRVQDWLQQARNW